MELRHKHAAQQRRRRGAEDSIKQTHGFNGDLQSVRRSQKPNRFSWSEAKVLKLHFESDERDTKLRRQRGVTH